MQGREAVSTRTNQHQLTQPVRQRLLGLLSLCFIVLPVQSENGEDPNPEQRPQ